MTVKLFEGDSRDTLKRFASDGVLFDACLTDSPYYLDSILKRFGGPAATAAKSGRDGAFSRSSRGFMGRRWDGADDQGVKIAQDPAFWRLVYDVLKPGAYLAAFSSPRTGHRQAVAIEDAGFIIHPFHGWTYAQGLPKPHSVARSIDKALGAKGTREAAGYQAATPEGRAWEGWESGAGAYKIALEPIYVAQKPFSESSAGRNVLKHGVGGINVAACLTGDRWPTTLLHDGSPEVEALFPVSPGQRGNVAAGGRDSGARVYYPMKAADRVHEMRGDSGSAARFFPSFPTCVPCEGSGEIHVEAEPGSRWPFLVDVCHDCGGTGLLQGPPVKFHPKVTSDAEREGTDHPTPKPVGLMAWLCRLFVPRGGLILDPFAGSGSTGRAALLEGMSAILCEAEPDYCAMIRTRFALPSPLTAADLALFERSPEFELFGDLL